MVQKGLNGPQQTYLAIRDITLFGEVEVPVKALMNCLPISIT